MNLKIEIQNIARESVDREHREEILAIRESNKALYENNQFLQTTFNLFQLKLNEKDQFFENYIS